MLKSKMDKKYLLLILTIFIYHFTYNYDNLVRVDRDDALTIASDRYEAGLQPYDTLTALNNPITTGTSSILYATFLSERNLSFLFWIWITAIFYNGLHFTKYALFIMFSLVFFQRTMMYGLTELYYGMIPMYYSFKYNKGYLMTLAVFNRIAYIMFALILFTRKPKTVIGFIFATAIICLLINPFPYLQNNITMIHVPAYPLDYSLLFILPLMLFINDKPFHFFHKYSIPGGFINGRSEYMLFCKCGKKKILAVDYIN